MKKLLTAGFIVLSFIFFILLSTLTNSKTIVYKLNNKTFSLLVADTPEKWERGLMYVRDLKNADGMVFIFPDKQPRTFWNKNTLVDLDVYWLENDTLVGKSSLPSIEKSKTVRYVHSPKPVDKVVELVR